MLTKEQMRVAGTIYDKVQNGEIVSTEKLELAAEATNLILQFFIGKGQKWMLVKSPLVRELEDLLNWIEYREKN